MRFTRLSSEDLQQLEPDFIKFLAANSITASDWIKLKEEDSKNAEELIDMFSDIVYEKVFRNIKYLDHRSKSSLMVFQLGDDDIQLYGLEVSEESKVDFTQENFLETLKSNPKVQVYSHEKKYSQNREDEIFQMMQSGCHAIDAEFFDAIAKMCKEA